MGLEFQIETYDFGRTEIIEFLQTIPQFHNKASNGDVHLSHDGETIGITVALKDSKLEVVQHLACSQTDALFGLIIRRILSLNDSIVVHGGY